MLAARSALEAPRILTNFIKVKWKFARNRTIESGFEKGGPVFVENVLAAGIAL